MDMTAYKRMMNQAVPSFALIQKTKMKMEETKMANAELTSIIKKFAESGWDVIDAPSKNWLTSGEAGTTEALRAAIEQADKSCGSCGCEFDPLYKKALVLLSA